MLSGQSFDLQGTNVLYINNSDCFPESQYLCAIYHSIGPYDPPIRDDVSDNDYQCVDISTLLNCIKGMINFAFSICH